MMTTDPTVTRTGKGAPARLADVALVAGVSIKTVSRVINNEAGVLEETRRKVLEAASTLGFVPNRMARSLKAGAQDTIGVIVDAIADPFFAEFVGEIEELALSRGLGVLFASTAVDPEREREQIIRLAGHQLIGLIAAPVEETGEMLKRVRGQMPVVCIDQGREGLDAVTVEDFESTYAAVAALTKIGHRRIAFVGRDVAHPQTTGRRLDGYWSALNDAQIVQDPALVIDCSPIRSLEEEDAAPLFALADPPTAIFCASARSAKGALEALKAAGLDAEVALISFGDAEMASMLSPAVSVIAHDPREIARAAFARFEELLADPHAAPQTRCLALGYIPRGSGEIIPTHVATLRQHATPAAEHIDISTRTKALQ